MAGFGVIDKVGVEGTGSYGAGIARHLTGKGIVVIEVDRPNRLARHRAGKTDVVDAIAAARAVLSGTATGTPKTRDGNIEAVRVLSVARRSAANEWIQIVTQMRHVCFTAPEEIRRRFQDMSPIVLVRTTAALRPRKSDGNVVRFSTLTTLRELGRRALFIREQKQRVTTQMRPLIRETAPDLLEIFGVGFDVAAKILVAAGALDSVVEQGADEVLALTTSMHDLVIAARPVGKPPHDVVLVAAPGSLGPTRTGWSGSTTSL